jgi:mycoredoxin
MAHADDRSATDHADNPPDEIVVYWRPGCPFCSSLKRGMHRTGLPFREVNIWSEPDGAAFVRSVARGNETVPTVTVGTATAVNPTARQVLELARAHTPALVPPAEPGSAGRRLLGLAPPWRRRRRTQ